MTSTSQAGYLLLGDATLDEKDAVLVAVARVLDRFLRVHTVVNKVDQYLRVALGLHRSAHHAEDRPQRSITSSQTGDESVYRAFTWSDGVRVASFQAERVAAVVETDAGSFGNDTAAETSVEAVYERTAIALRVYGAEIGSVAAWVGRRDRHCGVARDRSAQPRSVVFGEQLLSRYDGMCRISDPIVQVLEG